ncbi:putative protein [BD1-7 clade bacterium]|uniref:Ferredoxin--NADP reductase n=1 Tax=BD1-7 clade bacterium TaxID=2029982 RepID=A0A5S9P6F9_9GAMM|nr:putative protein [BD1-7 clade bacterium]
MSSNAQYKPVIVLGAGASGLMCAIEAGQRGRDVLVLNNANKPGKKILMSGGGRCNFTNLDVLPENYLSENPHFCRSALSQYTHWDFIGKVLEHGIAYEEREHGQLFCVNSAKDILNMLLDECASVGAEIRNKCDVQQVIPLDTTVKAHPDARYKLHTSHGDFYCDSLVIATGALSIPTMGATGFGYQLAENLQLPVIERRAGLVPFTFTGDVKNLCEHLSGIAIPATITCNGQQFSEALLFTHRGMSGPVVLQISNYWQLGDTISIDLLPSEDLQSQLASSKQQHPKTFLRSLLAEYLPKRLVMALQARCWADYADTPMAEMPDRILQHVAEQIHQWVVKPSGTEGYRTAEVTLGGVSTQVLSSKTMECNQWPGLYFIGEVVDVTGHLGGYNFQWAWSSGFVAGQNV